MEVDHVLQPAQVGTNQVPAESHSAEWWRSRTADELREIIVGGFEMGEMFTAATCEAERRSNELRAADAQAAQEEAERKKGLRRRILETFLLACLLAMIAMVLIR